ncbi:MAG: hypothetical protein DMF61_22600 [Blastocatellia bacterium AA13]|nr:MAG: hypothetical protein DMF61_22600 [Blastocatellia bacterium AA13]
MELFRDTQNGSTSISAAQHSSLFISLTSGENLKLGKDVRLESSRCQQAVVALLVNAQRIRVETETLYWSLAKVAAQARALADIETLELVSQIILGLPVSERAKSLALHYQAFCLHSKGRFVEAHNLLDNLLEKDLDPRLRARAVGNKAAAYFSAGEVDRSLQLHVKAGQLARDCDPVSLLTALQTVALIKSIHGDHRQSLADLESLVPFAFQVSRYDPRAFALVLNSYAVELGEMDHVEQALNVASRLKPFAFIHPEFNDTIAELESKLPARKHSVVVIQRAAEPVAALKTVSNPARKRRRQSTFIIREAERRFTSFRAPPPQRGRLIPSNLAVINPARQPAKPRAP